MKELQLLPNQRHVNAKNIDLFIQSELKGERNILIPEKADNVFDFLEKFQQERNSSLKFCFYGMVESKWGDCHDLRIDFKIGDSSYNVVKNPDTPFWFYDKSSGVSGLSWYNKSIPLDSDNGNLSKNIYGKRKGHYFFPFEIDKDNLTKTNKSLYIKVDDIIRDLYDLFEFPFLFFDEDNQLIEYGNENAVFNEIGDIIQYNNNYPFLYDRHWIRREIEPTGPPFIFFNQRTVTVDEGGSDPFTRSDKILEVEVSLSKPPSGNEKARIDIIYGLDENKNPYTTVDASQDLNINLGEISWDSTSSNLTKRIPLNLIDDFFVESTESFSLKITPIIGLLPHPDKPQIITYNFIDNDIPSKVAFTGPATGLIEPRSTATTLQFPIKLVLDRKLLVPDQSLIIYIDEELTDCDSEFGFLPDPNKLGANFQSSKKVLFNMNDLEYEPILYFRSKPKDDLPRKIVLKLTNLTSNLVQQSFTQGQSIDFTIWVYKDLDKNEIEVQIPYNPDEGTGVLRTAYKKRYPIDVGEMSAQTRVYAQKYELRTYGLSTNGFVTPNTLLTGNTTLNDLLVEASSKLIFEQEFKIEVKNLAYPIIFDNNFYDEGRTLTIDVYSGFTTSVSSDKFYYDGTKFILKLPCNFDFYSDNTGQVYGFNKFTGNISITNKSFNYIEEGQQNNSKFVESQKIKKFFYYGTNWNNSTNDYTYSDDIELEVSKNTVLKALTRIEQVESQIKWDNLNGTTTYFVSSYSGLSMQTSPYPLFYEGIIMTPNSYNIGNSPKKTQSRLIFVKDQIVDVNQFIQVNSNYPNIYNFPVSDLILDFNNLETYQGNLEIDFGPIYVQAGYKNYTLPFTGFQIDPFVLATVNYAAGNLSSLENKKLFLYNWDQANINTKNAAIIEIVNNGIVNSKILGFDLKPNEKLWISQIPIPTTNLQGTYNLVRSFNNLKINFKTNSVFKKIISYELNDRIQFAQLNKFTVANYKISFLNFQIYNFDGTNTNKTVNNSLDLSWESRLGIRPNGTVSLMDKKLYLFCKFTGSVLVPTNSQGVAVCNNGNIYDVRPSSPSYYTYIRGYVAKPTSINTKFDRFILYEQGNRIDFGNFTVSSCPSNGISWQIARN